jgi:spermidine synthase
VLHLGGGALTLPRRLAAARPGSAQRVVEHDAALVALVARRLPWPASVEVVVGDARTQLERSAGGGWDVVIADVFQAARSPASVATAGFYGAARRALRAGGLLIANVTDVPPLAYARTQVAGARGAFAEVAALGPAAVLRARRAGNVVLAASGGALPDRLDRAAERVLRGPGLAAFAAGARPLADPPG